MNTHSAFLDRLFENEVTNKDALNNLSRNFNEKTVEFNAHFEQIGNLLSKELVRKSFVYEVMSNMSRLIEEKIDTLEVELSSSIAKVKDECVSKIEAEKRKSSSSPNVDIDIRKNKGDINLLQDDVSDLKSEIREKDERIINLIKEIEEMKGKLNLLYIVEDEKGIDIDEGIDTVNY